MDDKETLDNQEVSKTSSSALLEENILNEFKKKQTVTEFTYPLNVTSIIFPDIEGTRLKERRLTFEAIADPDKALLYRMIVAAYNYAYINKFSSLSAKVAVERYGYRFVSWLNKEKIVNRYTVLKEYEAYCFDLLSSHGGYSVLNKLKPVLFYAFEVEEFKNSLTTEEAIYLRVLRATKISPNLNKSQWSLASYFGALDWLRRDDVGVGNPLYMTLASAKLTVKSLMYTASVLIIELFKIKSSFRMFLIENGFTTRDFQFPKFQNLSVMDKKVLIGQVVYRLLKKFHSLNEKPVYLEYAFELLLLSNVTNQSNFKKVRSALNCEQRFKELFHPKIGRNVGKFSTYFADRHFKSSDTGCLLSINVLAQLSDTKQSLPITTLETLMFSWIMASLTVQPSDIPKLSRNSFRQLKIGRRITHIECEYFKGRANAIHNTRTLTTRKPEGRALLIYLNQHSSDELSTYEGDIPYILNGLRSIFGSLVAVLGLPFIENKLAIIHRQRGQSPVILPLVLKALKALKEQPEISNQIKLFGLQAIKNSAVHAHSDPYTLHYLINHNSHTNKTEKLNYLTPDNEEFINAAGRITRSIMLDLINNVFDLDFVEPSKLKLSDNERKQQNKMLKNKKVAFNNEFGNVMDTISYKSEEMLSRLKVVTGQSKGVINQVGIMSLQNKHEDAFSPIYVLDSKVTAFKIFNYLHEFKIHYKKLLCRNPDYLYQTAFPHVEWMEHVLTKLSKSSVREGEALFEKMNKSGVIISVFHSI